MTAGYSVAGPEVEDALLTHGAVDESRPETGKPQRFALRNGLHLE